MRMEIREFLDNHGVYYENDADGTINIKNGEVKFGSVYGQRIYARTLGWDGLVTLEDALKLLEVYKKKYRKHKKRS